MKTSTNRIMAFFASLILSAGFAVCCFRIPALSAAVSSIGNVNLLTYAMTVILFCVSYLIFSILLARTEKPCFFDTPRNAFFYSSTSYNGKYSFLCPHVPPGSRCLRFCFRKIRLAFHSFLACTDLPCDRRARFSSFCQK